MKKIVFFILEAQDICIFVLTFWSCKKTALLEIKVNFQICDI